MIEIREFVPYDLGQMGLTPVTACVGEDTGELSYAMQLAAAGDCYTITTENRVIACLGTTDFWPGRRYLWAFLANETKYHMLSITRAAKKWLANNDGRLETAVLCHFPEAIRWAEMLGFEREGLMKGYMPAPEHFDCYLYSRVR